jgi:hypothetical protein
VRTGDKKVKEREEEREVEETEINAIDECSPLNADSSLEAGCYARPTAAQLKSGERERTGSR